MKENKIVTAVTETNPTLYKCFFRTYYKEKLKAANMITLILAIILFIAAAYLYYNGFPLMWPGICVWIGLILIVYPRNMFRRSYRKMKDTRMTIYFDFYDDHMTERSGGKSEDFKYSDIYKTIETNRYFYIFHSPENASVVEKSGIKSGDADKLRNLIKSK